MLGQRVAVGQATQGLERGAAKELVAQEIEEGRRGAGVGDLSEGVDGRVLEPGLGAGARR